MKSLSSPRSFLFLQVSGWFRSCEFKVFASSEIWQVQRHFGPKHEPDFPAEICLKDGSEIDRSEPGSEARL